MGTLSDGSNVIVLESDEAPGTWESASASKHGSRVKSDVRHASSCVECHQMHELALLRECIVCFLIFEMLPWGEKAENKARIEPSYDRGYATQ